MNYWQEIYDSANNGSYTLMRAPLKALVAPTTVDTNGTIVQCCTAAGNPDIQLVCANPTCTNKSNVIKSTYHMYPEINNLWSVDCNMERLYFVCPEHIEQLQNLCRTKFHPHIITTDNHEYDLNNFSLPINFMFGISQVPINCMIKNCKEKTTLYRLDKHKSCTLLFLCLKHVYGYKRMLVKPAR